MNLFEAIFTRQSPEAVAIAYEQRRITYAELREKSLNFARIIQALAIAPGDRVALLLNDGPEFIACFVATCSSGAIGVPINMALRLDEQQAILKDCTASVAIVESERCESLLAEARDGSSHLRNVVVVVREKSEGQLAPELQRMQKEYREGLTIRSLDELLNETRNEPEPVFPAPSEDSPAFILYTSGSTGEPKGAVHRQADIYHTNETFCREVLRVGPRDRLFSSSRLPFAYGLGNSLSFPLLNGATTILCRDKPTPQVIHRIFCEDQPTIFFGVPVVYNLLLEHHRNISALDCSSLRLCVSAGEALPGHLGEQWEQTFGLEVLDGIGSTEMLHMWMSNHEGKVCYGSSGKLLGGYGARLLDQDGEPTPAGEVGNLWVKGASAAIGYWKRPEVSARTFVDGWVRTGDLYRVNQDGYWFHMGRSDDCFKSSGQWVSPVEVEGVLIRHSGVKTVAVVEDFDDGGLPCPCAFVVRVESASDDANLEEELRLMAKEALPRFKRPRKYLFVAELPYTATGKIQRFKLRKVQCPMSNVQRLLGSGK